MIPVMLLLLLLDATWEHATGVKYAHRRKGERVSTLLVKVELECKWNLMLTIFRSATATNVAHTSRFSKAADIDQTTTAILYFCCKLIAR